MNYVVSFSLSVRLNPNDDDDDKGNEIVGDGGGKRAHL